MTAHALALPVQILPATMTSLPIPAARPEQILCASDLLQLNAGNPGVLDEQCLLRAFRSFSEVAGSLERSYGTLRAEVERLRRELTESNTDLARSLEENRSMRLHLDRILSGLPCGVLVVAGNDQISQANPEARRLLGIDAGGATSFFSVSELPVEARHLLEAARTRNGEHEMSFAESCGSIRWLAARHAVLSDGTARASVFILRDVSERKRLEETETRHRRDQALAEVSAVLAHEIRNPLGSLELFAGLLAEAPLDAECHQWIEHVQAGLRTLAATVNNVLHFHSLPEPNRVPVDLGQLLAWAHDFFLPLARQSGVTLSLQNRLPGVSLPADRHRLEQVLLNLVLNSVRAMPMGGWVELSGYETQNGDSVVLSVADTGPGISTQHLSSIFEPGFSTNPGSPGLGLAVCSKIVQQHGGTISASNRAGAGALFILTFPLNAPPLEEVSK